MAQTLWVENEKQFSGDTDVGAKISKRKLEKKKIEREKKEMEWRRKTAICVKISFSDDKEQSKTN